MQIEFIVDYRGYLTNEQFFEAGATVDLPDREAERLLAAGRAVAVQSAPLHGTAVEPKAPAKRSPERVEGTPPKAGKKAS